MSKYDDFYYEDDKETEPTPKKHGLWEKIKNKISQKIKTIVKDALQELHDSYISEQKRAIEKIEQYQKNLLARFEQMAKSEHGARLGINFTQWKDVRWETPSDGKIVFVRMKNEKFLLACYQEQTKDWFVPSRNETPKIITTDEIFEWSNPYIPVPRFKI